MQFSLFSSSILTSSLLKFPEIRKKQGFDSKSSAQKSVSARRACKRVCNLITDLRKTKSFHHKSRFRPKRDFHFVSGCGLATISNRRPTKCFGHPGVQPTTCLPRIYFRIKVIVSTFVLKPIRSHLDVSLGQESLIK